MFELTLKPGVSYIQDIVVMLMSNAANLAAKIIEINRRGNYAVTVLNK